VDLGLRGKKAIVCASSRGLGRACASALAEAGVAVTINGRDRHKLDETAAEIVRATGAHVTAVAADVSTREGQDRLLAACPQPDILVNNNGGPPFRDFRAVDRDALFAGVVMNMATPIELVQRTVHGMIERGFGRIVNITAIAVKLPVPGYELSSGARGGLTAFLAGVARTVAPHGVTINNIMPGYFETDRVRKVFEATAKAGGRPTDEVVAECAACAFLCSRQAGYITGQNLLIDGGRYASAF